MDSLPVQIAFLRSTSRSKALIAVLILSAAVLAFLVWLLYFNRGSATDSPIVAALPAVSASFNALSALLLICGYVAVRKRRLFLHVKLMLSAVVSSALFLSSYITYHSIHADTRFLATGIVRPIYFSILISHILLSGIVVPMILMTLYLALSARFAAHRRLARYTLPIWLYVSITGVLIFAMLKTFNP